MIRELGSVTTGRRDFSELADELLRSGTSLRIRAQGRSMYPFIKHGDFLEVEPVEIASIRVGDVALCCYGGETLVTHRVVGVSAKDGCVVLDVKGDWAPRADPLVYPEQVLGRVAAIDRGEKRIRLDRGTRRHLEVIWAKISPYSRWLYFPLRAAVHAAWRVRNRL